MQNNNNKEHLLELLIYSRKARTNDKDVTEIPAIMKKIHKNPFT